jgi:hypothetical protein
VIAQSEDSIGVLAAVGLRIQRDKNSTDQGRNQQQTGQVHDWRLPLPQDALDFCHLTIIFVDIPMPGGYVVVK